MQIDLRLSTKTVFTSLRNVINFSMSISCVEVLKICYCSVHTFIRHKLNILAFFQTIF